MKKNFEIGIYDYLNMDIPFDKLSKPRNKHELKLYHKRHHLEYDRGISEDINHTNYDENDSYDNKDMNEYINTVIKERNGIM
jgi:hypothetical protein